MSSEERTLSLEEQLRSQAMAHTKENLEVISESARVSLYWAVPIASFTGYIVFNHGWNETLRGVLVMLGIFVICEVAYTLILTIQASALTRFSMPYGIDVPRRFVFIVMGWFMGQRLRKIWHFIRRFGRSK